MLRPDPPPVTYADAGVSIERGDLLVERIKPVVRRTFRPGVMGDLGGFGSLFDLSVLGCRQPVLVSGTDGAGTKIKLAIDTGRHDDIGVDLVAMCVNDVLVQGAEPIFFLDYFVCGTLDVGVAERVVGGIARGCELAGCALVGGETAEHPGLHPAGDYDLAGFCVGVVERDAIIDGRDIRPGDQLIGVASSGPHANGFSLVRKLLADTGTRPEAAFGSVTFADVLLAPTRIYVKPVLNLIRKVTVKGIAHITGGGITENLPRVLPRDVTAVVQRSSWRQPEIFSWLRDTGKLPEAELLRTFNCGVGLVLVVAPGDTDAAVRMLRESGEEAWIAGEIRTGAGDPRVTFVP